MKNIIKITEEDLHNIISESVKQIVSELDWRTYDSAYKKSQEKSLDKGLSPEEQDYHFRRSLKFRNAADKNLNKKYGVTQSNYNTHIQSKNDRQQLGAAEIGRHKRGGDEYSNGKWRKK